MLTPQTANVDGTRKFVFVLGAHRSGTSLFAAACDALGVRLGEHFLAPNSENPKGFFEDEEVVRLNDRLLRSSWLSWDALGYLWQEDFSAPHYRPYHEYAVRLLRERFAAAPLAGLKDPRFCLLLPFWQSVVREALEADVYYLLALRHPAHCARSQKARNIADDDFHLIGKRREHVLMLWATYMQQALRGVAADLAPGKLAIFDYEAMLQAPAGELRRLGRFLNTDHTTTPAREFATRFVDASLNGSVSETGNVRQTIPEIWRWTESVYLSLHELSAHDALVRQDLTALLTELDLDSRQALYLRETQHLYGYAYRKVLSLRHRLLRSITETRQGYEREHALRQSQRQLQLEKNSLQQQHDSLDRRLQEILDSRAWQFILRLRAIKAALGLSSTQREP